MGLGRRGGLPPTRVGLQDLGGPIPSAGYVNRRSRIPILSPDAYHKSHTKIKAEFDDRGERGAKLLENVQYIFR